MLGLSDQIDHRRDAVIFGLNLLELRLWHEAYEGGHWVGSESVLRGVAC